MRVTVDNQVVRKNIELFLQIMQRAEEKKAAPEKEFSAYIHRTTGQLFFDGLKKGASLSLDREWQPIQLTYRFDPIAREISFELAKGQEGELADLAPSAEKVMRQTIGVLQKIASQLAGPSDLETKLSVITRHLHIDLDAAGQNKNLMVAIWRHCDRREAEDLLMAKPVGTYLFRKDFYAEVLEAVLSERFGREVKCITATFLADRLKITDLTFVHIDHCWKQYNDDVSLQGKGHPELLQVLQDFKQFLRFPLYH